jgi:hypothetical protein
MFRPSLIPAPPTGTTTVDGVPMRRVQQTEVGGPDTPGCADNLGTGCYCDIPTCGRPDFVAVPQSNAPYMAPNFVFRTKTGETIFADHYMSEIPSCGKDCKSALVRGALSGLQPIIGENESVFPAGTY